MHDVTVNETGIQKSKVHSGRINYFTYSESHIVDSMTLLRRCCDVAIEQRFDFAK